MTAIEDAFGDETTPPCFPGDFDCEYFTMGEKCIKPPDTRCPKGYPETEAGMAAYWASGSYGPFELLEGCRLAPKISMHNSPGLKAKFQRLVGRLFRRVDWYDAGRYSINNLEMFEETWRQLKQMQKEENDEDTT